MILELSNAALPLMLGAAAVPDYPAQRAAVLALVDGLR